MASLNGQTIASSYEQLLHVDRDGGGNANTLVSVKDGDNGTTFGIKLATNKVEIIPGSNDTNAFEVSQADGTAVLTVDSTNARIGIGGAPLKPLHILDDDPVIRISDANSSSLATATPHIEFYDRANTNQLGMIGYLSTGDGILSIHNKNNASVNFSTNNIERLEIDNAGTFFINGDGSDQTTKWHTGSAYVNAKLDVRQLAIAFSGSDKVTSNTSGDFTFANTLTIGSIADEGDAIITNGADAGRYDVLTVQEDGNTRWELSFEGNGSTNSLTFGSNVGEQNIANGGVLTLLPDGQVGIGCTPDAKLKIQENTNGDNVVFSMRAHNAGGTSKTITFTLDPDDESLTLTNLAAYKIDQASTGQFGNTALQTIDGGDNAGVNIEHGGGDGRVRVASAGSFRTEYLANQLKATANGFDIRTTDAQNVTISTNDSERMRIASGGNVGIGCTDAEATFQVNTGVSDATIAAIDVGYGIEFNGGTNGHVGLAVIDGSAGRGKNRGFIGFRGKDASSMGHSHIVFGTSDGVATDTEERMRIDTNGTVMIGGTLAEDVGAAPGLVIQKASGQNGMAFEILDDDSSADSGNTLMALRFDQDNNCDGAGFIEFQDSGGVIGSIKCNGAASVVYNTTSDERLKENIADVGDGYLALINDIKIRSFDWKDRPNLKNKVGVIAQELEKVIPNAVSKGEDDVSKLPYQVSYSTLVPYLIKAVQELSAKVDELENKLGE